MLLTDEIENIFLIYVREFTNPGYLIPSDLTSPPNHNILKQHIMLLIQDLLDKIKKWI